MYKRKILYRERIRKKAHEKKLKTIRKKSRSRKEKDKGGEYRKEKRERKRSDSLIEGNAIRQETIMFFSNHIGFRWFCRRSQ